MRSYDSEDQVLQALIETNIRQRGTVGGSAKKVGRRIVELERIYGIKNGNNQHKRLGNSFQPSISQEELAEKIGMTVRTMNNYKQLLDMIPELEDLVDTGIVTPSTALAIMRELPEDEQRDFIASLPEVEGISREKARELMAEYKETQKPTEENEDLKRKLKTAEEELKITEEERSEFKKKYSEAKDELKRYKETFGNDKNILSATQEIQLLTAATNEYVKRHGGKVWAFNEFDKIDSSVKEDYIKSLKMLNAFTQQMIINVGGNIV